jgi:O-acetyl-ADP-ribose deacetylase (regulator of RNase III)
VNVGSPGERIRLHLGDITALDVDAIVNAANASLLPGGGVCGAIHRAAGPELQVECRAVGGCPVGEARLTRGYRLSARWVIHAVGPVWRGGEHGEAERLSSCYRASLELAARHGIATLAFPAISTGIFGYPLEPATRIAFAETLAGLARHGSLLRVTFACFDAGTHACYERVRAELVT